MLCHKLPASILSKLPQIHISLKTCGFAASASNESRILAVVAMAPSKMNFDYRNVAAFWKLLSVQFRTRRLKRTTRSRGRRLLATASGSGEQRQHRKVVPPLDEFHNGESVSIRRDCSFSEAGESSRKACEIGNRHVHHPQLEFSRPQRA